MDKLYVKITLCVVICLGLGIASGFSTAESVNGWYETIRKPGWNPPNRLFGPVWTVLYILMGIAAALVWHSNLPNKKTALILFAVQFLLNILWSYIFFGMHNILLAFADILLLSVMIAITIAWFLKINKVAAWLLLPYFMWVSFASTLNFSIYLLNNS